MIHSIAKLAENGKWWNQKMKFTVPLWTAGWWRRELPEMIRGSTLSCDHDSSHRTTLVPEDIRHRHWYSLSNE
jgi:hypothetical protein